MGIWIRMSEMAFVFDRGASARIDENGSRDRPLVVKIACSTSMEAAAISWTRADTIFMDVSEASVLLHFPI